MKNKVMPGDYPIGRNIRELREALGKTKVQFAIDTNISTPMLSNYETNMNLPPTGYLLTLKQQYNIDLNKFVTIPLGAEEIADAFDNPLNPTFIQENNEKFVGVYALYYYDTTGGVGGAEESMKDAVNQGLLVIFPHNETSLRTLALLNISRVELADLFKKASGLCKDKTSFDNKRNQIRTHFVRANASNVYDGYMTFTRENMFIDLAYGSRDKVLIILRNPHSEQSEYLGGIGTMNSVSRGKARVPCMQLIGISSHLLCISCEELEQRLLLKSFQPNVHRETIELISVMQELYVNKKELSQLLSPEQKETIVESLLSGHISQLIQTNSFRLGKVFSGQDDAWYHMIKAYRGKQ